MTFCNFFSVRTLSIDIYSTLTVSTMMLITTRMRLSLFSACLLALSSTANADVNEAGQETYPLDSSWAITSDTLLTTFGDKQTVYDTFMKRCNEEFQKQDDNGGWDCSDSTRIKMNSEQPLGMRNYTRLGFTKIKAPERVFNLLSDFWERNKDKQTHEWNHVTPFHNTWDSMTTMADVQKEGTLRMDIWDSAKDVLEEWTGKYLAHCSIWGIRSYHNKSILAPHLDRNPLVSSAIINVAQDVDEPWPLEVWGHDGKPYNITMEPGDMVLYESHSVIHGRPFPMNGNFFANIFVHYEVIGSKDKETGELYLNEEDQASRDAGLPPYIVPDTPWAEEWLEKNPNGWELFAPINPMLAAESNDIKNLKVQLVVNKESLFEGDDNGWQPIHNAARKGHVDVIDFLLKNGADVDARTNIKAGSYSPLKIALIYLGQDHPVVSFLEKNGGHVLSVDDDNEL